MDQIELKKDLKISRDLAVIAYDALEDKLGQEITVLDIHEISVLADYFLIVHGNNGPHVQALVDAVDEALGKNGYPADHIEGYRDGNWALVDFNRIIVHVFNKESRFFYDLERIWADGKEIDIADIR